MNHTEKPKKARHTPGPWQVGFGFVKNERKDGQKIVRIVAPHPEGGGQDIAECLECSAALIASAPELLDACKYASMQVESRIGSESWAKLLIEKLEKAIAKAEGGAQ